MTRFRYISLLLALVTLAVYLPVRQHSFVSYDDPVYVTGNPHVQAGLQWAGLQWAFTTGHAGNWHPLTWLSHLLDVTLFGQSPAGPHLVNLLFHIANTLLLFLLLLRLTSLQIMGSARGPRAESGGPPDSSSNQISPAPAEEVASEWERGFGGPPKPTRQRRVLPGALWRSALVAALFALHPLHVESVAWVAERKDVFSAFFGLLTLLMYARYVSGKSHQSSVISHQSIVGYRASGETDHRSLITDHSSPFDSRHYWLALLCFTLGLMCKPMLVTLPFVLLLLDYWPLGRVSGAGGADGEHSTFNTQHSTLNEGQGADRRKAELQTDHASRFTFHVSRFTLARLLWEKAPFLLLSAAACVVTFAVQRQGGAVQTLEAFSVSERIGNALVAYARYLGKTFWPADLAAPYPHPGHWPTVTVALAALLVAGLCFGALWLGRRFPFVFTGWCWFFGMLIPTIGLVQVGDQSMADRYTYLPLIGVFIVLAWGAGEAVARWRWSKALFVGAAALGLIACAGQTARQLRYWQDSESLFRHAIAVTKGNSLAHNNLGNALLGRQQVDEALAHFRQALEMKPDYADAHLNLGNALIEQGQVDEAIAQFQVALRLQPGFADAHYNLGNVLLQKARVNEAVDHFQKAVQHQPEHVLAHNNLANAFWRQGRLDEAIIHYRAAVNLRPDFVVARHNLGTVLLQQGQPEEAVAQYRKLVELQPGSANVLNNLGWMLRQTGRFDEAIIPLRKALEIQPDYPEAHGNLARTLVLKGRTREAVTHYRAALKGRPDDAEYKSELARLLATDSEGLKSE